MKNKSNKGVVIVNGKEKWERKEREITKCVLLCANCHREIEAGVTQLPRETLK